MFAEVPSVMMVFTHQPPDPLNPCYMAKARAGSAV